MTKQKVIAFVFLTSYLFSFIFVVFSPFFALKANVVFDCLTLRTSSNQADKDYCKSELSQIEAELAKLLNLQKEQKKQTGTLKGDVDYLTSQINALKAKIKARALVITQLKVNIAEKESVIRSLSEKIEREHESLSQLLRNTNEFDDKTMVDLILSEDSIFNFYSDLESYASIKQAVKASADVIRGIKVETEVVKKDLENKRGAETDAKAELESAQKSVIKSETDKKQLLAISKQTEATYQKLATEKKIRADRIRAALFPLAGASKAIPFGTALQFANEAKDKTGIDPAFLLAILTQESNLGANVGQCYLTNPDTGSGVGKNTGTVFTNAMKPMGMPGRKGDVEDFLDITSKLSLQWNLTPVSCPIANVGGYGGAMGPAQFIPSTWKIFINRLQVALGYYPNPWEPEDAFMASSMYLTDLGAIGVGANAQNIAACKYYGSGGKSCSYSKSVMALKAKIQTDIDLLSN